MELEMLSSEREYFKELEISSLCDLVQYIH